MVQPGLFLRVVAGGPVLTECDELTKNGLNAGSANALVAFDEWA
jgi:hypothetical protein